MLSPKINKRNLIRLKTFNEGRLEKKEEKTFEQVMKNLKTGFITEQNNYTEPGSFEGVPGIDVSLTDLRKMLVISIGDAKVELTKEQAENICEAIDKATKRMP
jgi:hypothetical protein